MITAVAASARLWQRGSAFANAHRFILVSANKFPNYN